MLSICSPTWGAEDGARPRLSHLATHHAPGLCRGIELLELRRMRRSSSFPPRCGTFTVRLNVYDIQDWLKRTASAKMSVFMCLSEHEGFRKTNQAQGEALCHYTAMICVIVAPHLHPQTLHRHLRPWDRSKLTTGRNTSWLNVIKQFWATLDFKS